MKKIVLALGMVVLLLDAIGQTEAGEALRKNVIDDEIPLKHALIKSSYSPFKTKLSSFLTKISVSSTLNAGENARADLSYVANKDSNFLVGISINQQIGSNDYQATPFDLADGFNAGTTVGINLSYINWKPKLSKTDFDNFNKSADAFAQRSRLDRRMVTYNDIRENGSIDEKKLLPKLKNPVFFNLVISFSKSSFAFATDSVNLEQYNANYITPDIDFSVGILSSISSYLAISYTYSNYYLSAGEVSFNLPFGSSGNFISETLGFGSPEKASDNRISIQWSKMFGSAGSIGINPAFTVGLTSKKAAVTLPVYFIKGVADGKPNGLQGGIQLGYVTRTNGGSFTSFKDGFGAQLIIGLPFDVFANLK